MDHTEAIAEFNHTLQLINQQARVNPKFIYFDYCPPLSPKTSNIIIILQTNIQNIPQSALSAEEFDTFFINKINTNQLIIPSDPEFPEVLNYIFWNQQGFQTDAKAMVQSITQKWLALKAYHWIDHEIVFSYGEDPQEVSLTINSMIQNNSFAIIIQLNQLEAVYSWEHLLTPQIQFEKYKNTAESEIQALKEDNSALKENLELCAERIRNLEAEANATKAKMFDFQETATIAQNKSAELLSQRTELEAKLSETEVLLNEMSTNLMNAQQKIKNSDDFYEEKLNQERLSRQKLISDLEQKANQMAALNDNLRSQIQILEAQLSGRIDEYKELKNISTDQENRLDAQTTTIDRLKQQLNNKDDEIEKLREIETQLKERMKNIIQSNKGRTIDMLKSIEEAENMIEDTETENAKN